MQMSGRSEGRFDCELLIAIDVSRRTLGKERKRVKQINQGKSVKVKHILLWFRHLEFET